MPSYSSHTFDVPGPVPAYVTPADSNPKLPGNSFLAVFNEFPAVQDEPSYSYDVVDAPPGGP